MTKSGTIGNPIVFDAYGDITLPLPKITVLETLGSWTKITPNIWESTCINCMANTRLQLLLYDSKSKPMGRYPNFDALNKGYLNYESNTTTGSTGTITDLDFSFPDNEFQNAEISLRSNRWTINVGTLTSHTGSTLAFNINVVPVGSISLTNGFGYFIQNHIKTLDQEGEWCYDKVLKKLKIYHIGSPGTKVKVPIKNQLFSVWNKKYIEIRNIFFALP